MPRRWGFTGTRTGMTAEQRSTFRTWLTLADDDGNELHHGDCLGSDADADDIVECVANGRPQYWRRIAHPPVDPKLRAFCKASVILEPKEYHARNRDIVDATTLLIATPKGETGPMTWRGSGTWYTIHYALRKGRPVLIIWADGLPERWGSWPAVDSPSGASTDRPEDSEVRGVTLA